MTRRPTLLSALLALAIGVALIQGPSIAQSAAVIWGTNSSGTAIRLGATSAGYLNVSIQGGVIPSFTAGTSTTTVKPGGAVGTGTVTDASVQNQWNVVEIPLTANVLSTNGNHLTYLVSFLLAANANNKEYMTYFAPSTATCSGSGASLCNAGCQVQTNATTNNAISFTSEGSISRTSSGNQKYMSRLTAGTSIQAQTVGTCSVTDSAATKIVFGIRNTAAAAASIQTNFINVYFWGY